MARIIIWWFIIIIVSGMLMIAVVASMIRITLTAVAFDLVGCPNDASFGLFSWIESIRFIKELERFLQIPRNLVFLSNVQTAFCLVLVHLHSCASRVGEEHVFNRREKHSSNDQNPTISRSRV